MSFDQYAYEWDTEKRINRAQHVAVEIKRSLSQSRYDQALEFGCGTGLVSYNLIDLSNQTTMVDLSKEMIGIVKEKAIRNDVKNITALNIDIMKSETDNKYDLIYSSMVLHHISDIEAVLKRLYTLMNSNGEICLVDIDKEDGSFHLNYPEFNGHNGFDHEALRTIFEKVGFKNVNIHTFYYDTKEVKGKSIEYSLFRIVANK